MEGIMKKLFAKIASLGEGYISSFKLRNQIFLKNDLEQLALAAAENGKSIIAYDRVSDEVSFLDEAEAMQRRNEKGIVFYMVGQSQVPEGVESSGEANYFLTALEQ